MGKARQLAKLGITVTDIVNAIQAQNKVNPAGQVGGEPAPRISNSPIPFSLKAVSTRRSNLETSSFVKRRTAESSG